jgi:hypothetical protein
MARRRLTTLAEALMSDVPDRPGDTDPDLLTPLPTERRKAERRRRAPPAPPPAPVPEVGRFSERTKAAAKLSVSGLGLVAAIIGFITLKLDVYTTKEKAADAEHKNQQQDKPIAQQDAEGRLTWKLLLDKLDEIGALEKTQNDQLKYLLDKDKAEEDRKAERAQRARRKPPVPTTAEAAKQLDKVQEPLPPTPAAAVAEQKAAEPKP